MDRLRQQLLQSEQSFPKEQRKLDDEHGNVPYNRSKVVQDILESPGAVSGMSTGPVVPIGNSPFAKTMQFAAPEGNGQVPSDTVGMDIPDKDIGISPSRVQAYLHEKAKRGEGNTVYIGNNPVTKLPLMKHRDGSITENGRPYYGPVSKQYSPKLIGQINDRPIMWNPTDMTLEYADDKSPVPAAEWKEFVKLGGPTLSFQTDPDGNMFGFATTGPDKGTGTPAMVPTGEAPAEATPDAPNPKPPLKSFTKATPQSEKIQAELRNLKDARAFVGKMKGLFDEVKKRGNVGLVTGNVTRAANFVTGGAFDPAAETYNTNRNAFAASLRGLTGDDSRFSDADREALKGVLAKIEKNVKPGEIQWDLVKGILDVREEIRLEDKKLGRDKTTTEMSIKEPAKGKTRTVNYPGIGPIKITE